MTVLLDLPSDLGSVIGGCIALFISCSIAAAGGIGGGGLNVPILLVFFQFDYKTAVVLSLCTVLGNYTSQSTVNFNKRHPYKQSRPLIYYDAVLCLLPAQIGGSNIGVIISLVSPETILLILAIFVITYAGLKTFKKGMVIFRSETDVLYGLVHTPLIDGALSSTSNSTNSFFNDINDKDITDINDDINDDIGAEEEDDRRDNEGVLGVLTRTFSLRVETVRKSITTHSSYSSQPMLINKIDHSNANDSYIPMEYPKTILIVLAIVWSIYAIINISMQSFTLPCTVEYYILLTATYPPLLLTVLWGVRFIARQQRKQPSSIIPGDLEFNKMSVGPPILAFVIGSLCSLLGIGGGELMGPLLLGLKVLPQVSSATTSFMSLLTSSSIIVHYGILGQIPYAWGVIVFLIGFCGGFTGRTSALYITRVYGRASITIFMLTVVLMLSFCLLIYHLASTETDFLFHNLC